MKLLSRWNHFLNIMVAIRSSGNLYRDKHHREMALSFEMREPSPIDAKTNTILSP